MTAWALVRDALSEGDGDPTLMVAVWTGGLPCTELTAEDADELGTPDAQPTNATIVTTATALTRITVMRRDPRRRRSLDPRFTATQKFTKSEAGPGKLSTSPTLEACRNIR